MENRLTRQRDYHHFHFIILHHVKEALSDVANNRVTRYENAAFDVRLHKSSKHSEVK